MDRIQDAYKAFLADRQQAGLLRELTPLDRPNAREISHAGRTYLNFSGNDYLGLSFHPALTGRAREWTAKYGAGSPASRLVTGNLSIYEGLEAKIAAFKRKEAALVMVSGFQANASVLPALFDKTVLGEDALVFADKLNHASMHVGCAASGVQQIRYAHNDINHLEDLLKKHPGRARFILTESVFSMDGDIAPLPDLYRLSREYGCFLIVDEAHATGVMGEQGRGLADGADLVIGTFGKAMGSFGAYIACTRDVKDYLVNKCAGLIYATSLPPAVLGAIDAGLDFIPGMDKERAHLKSLSTALRAALADMGYDCGPSQSQIVPVITGSNEATLALSATLKQDGLWVTAIRPPTVPKGSARLRVALSSAHTHGDLARLCDSLRSRVLKKAA